jgi:hypothetical protein
MPRIPLAFAALAPLALAGCAGGGSGGDLLDLSALTGGGARELRYECDDDRSFRVSFNRDRDRATVEAGDRTYRLRLTDRDGDRRQYGEDDVRLTVDDDGGARLRIADERDYDDCDRA